MKYEILNEEVSLTLRHEIDSQQNCVSLLVDDHGHQHDIRQQKQKNSMPGVIMNTLRPHSNALCPLPVNYPH